MAIQSLRVRTTNFTAAQASKQILAPATVRPKILEIKIVQATATAQTLGLGRPAAIAVTPVNVLFQTHDPAEPASTINGAISWATSPTAPTVFLDGWNSAATIGVGVIWTFPRGLIVPVSAAIVIWNITTAVATDITTTLDA
jgi:hypothetical protein